MPGIEGGADADLRSQEVAAIEEKWIKTGKMISWQMLPGGFRIIGPQFLGIGEDEGLSLWFYTFPDLEKFKEWAIGAPEHIALHRKVVEAMKASATAGQSPLPSYSFHATDDPHADTDWVNMPPGSVQIMMLGNHD